ncbi:alpha/beta fold hydrolase [Paenarthrobacter sp. NPDC090520]|uniref:alpha/beta fold hydrolase n=1 Tax=Paenarthrobacter sp. NPDC090520 TaxID=3364382 RepID=UPI003801C20D
MTTYRYTPQAIELSRLTTNHVVSGEGPNLLWISGGGYRGSAWHDHFVPNFEKAFRNITFDNRGTPGTECADLLPWSIADMASDAADLLEQTCDSPATVVGHSMGAFVALQLALDRPDLVASVVSLAGGARGDSGWVGDYMRAEIALRAQGVRMPADFHAIHYAPMYYTAEALGNPQTWNRIQTALSESQAIEDMEASIPTQWRACVDFNVQDRVPALAVPLDVVSFEQDQCAPPAEGELLANLAPGAKFHVLPGLGHCSMFEHNPETVSNYLAWHVLDPNRNSRVIA